jgi:Tol biopolymer transport system component
MSGHIFISYARADEGFVDGLIAKLHQRGLEVWLDRDSIEGGAAWRAAITEAIRECQAFLVVLSPNSINSKHVSRELSLAESRNRLIVPIMYRQCDLPASMEYHLTELQRIDFTAQPDEEAFRRLVRVLIRPTEGATSQAVEPSVPASTEQRVALVERTEARILEPARRAIRRVTTKVVVSERRLAEVDPASWIPETLAVSHDNQRIAYIVRVGGFLGLGVKLCVVVNGRAERTYSDITQLIRFSPVSDRVAYGAQDGDKWRVVVDGKEGKKYDGLGSGDPIFSADGHRIAYGALEGDKWMVVVDGKEGKKYDGLLSGPPIFSADGQRVVYGARDGDKCMVVVDRKEGKKYDGVLSGTPIFSADGQRVAYGANEGDKWMVVVDGKEGKKYDGVLSGTPIFSADGQRVAYGAVEGDKWMVVVDEEEGDAYSSIGELAFSPDGSRVATEVQVGDRWRVVVDGVGENTYDDMLRGGHITFGAADRLHWIAINGNEILLATARIE